MSRLADVVRLLDRFALLLGAISSICAAGVFHSRHAPLWAVFVLGLNGLWLAGMAIRDAYAEARDHVAEWRARDGTR